MRVAQLLHLVKSFVVNAVCLFSPRPPQLGNTAYPSPPNPPPVPAIDHDLPCECYSEAVRQLRPLFPSTCTSFEADEVKVVGDTPIDAGGYADIWEGTLNGHCIIQKSYRCYEACDMERVFRRYLREVSACTQLSHPNIVPFVGITSTSNHPFSLILDTAGHTGLREYLDKNPEADRLKLVQGIARGLEHVHDLGIVHGHLCSQNILVGPDGTPRIAGFGSSFTISRPDPWSEMDVVGFHRGSAPELIRPQKPGEPVVPITKASDMYAFGMLTWEIFS